MRVGVYPGSFDPLTIAHVAVADAALEQCDLDRLELAVSTVTLGKGHLGAASVERRVARLRDAVASRPALAVVVVTSSLIVDIAEGYDVVVMGADKWAQVNDPAWYADDPARRDAALARLPRVAVAPRSGWSVEPEFALTVPEHLGEVSASAVRSGRSDWAAG